jgi:hypothetical protein
LLGVTVTVELPELPSATVTLVAKRVNDPLPEDVPDEDPTVTTTDPEELA